MAADRNRALILGASEGIGAAFALQLAAAGRNLILVARREEPLRQIQQKITRLHPSISVEIQVLDLGSSDLADALQGICDRFEVDLVIYNAARSLTGRFLEQSLDDKLNVVDVNVRGPLLAADIFGRRMAERGQGGIILVSSLAGMLGAGYVAVYGASKAFDTVLAEGLWVELRDAGVDILACIAGATRTPGYVRTTPRDAALAQVMEPEEVARIALKQLGKRAFVITGARNRVSAFIMNRLLPRHWAIRIFARTTKAMLVD